MTINLSGYTVTSVHFQVLNIGLFTFNGYVRVDHQAKTAELYYHPSGNEFTVIL